MGMKEWAKREIELACKKENPNLKEGEFDYGCSCYESAMKAYESLCEDNHSRNEHCHDKKYIKSSYRWTTTYSN